MIVKNYMSRQVATISPDLTVGEGMKKLVEEKTNSLIVVDSDNRPIGLFSSYSVIQEVVPPYLKDNPSHSQFGAEGTLDKYAKLMKDKKISEVMFTGFHTLAEEDAMIEAAAYSIEAARRILPVADKDGKLIGKVTRTCIKNALHDAMFKNS